MKQPAEIGLATAFAADLFGPEHFIDHGDLGAGNFIVPFSYGNRLDDKGEIVPGPTNVAIAEVALGLSRSHHFRPIIAQHEVAAVLGNACVPINREDGYYMDSQEFAESVSHNLQDVDPDEKRVVAVGHRLHVARSMVHLMDAGIMPVAFAAVSPVPLMDSASNESWTRGRIRWGVHETYVFTGLALRETFPSLFDTIRHRSIAAKHAMTQAKTTVAE